MDITRHLVHFYIVNQCHAALHQPCGQALYTLRASAPYDRFDGGVRHLDVRPIGLGCGMRVVGLAPGNQQEQDHAASKHLRDVKWHTNLRFQMCPTIPEMDDPHHSSKAWTSNLSREEGVTGGPDRVRRDQLLRSFRAPNRWVSSLT